MGESGEDVEMQQKVERWVSLSARGLAGENKLLNLIFLFPKEKLGVLPYSAAQLTILGGNWV